MMWLQWKGGLFNGFGYIWVQQGINCNMEATRDDLKTRLQDQFRQE